jgi:mono/diheme cytochrome c family protein
MNPDEQNKPSAKPEPNPPLPAASLDSQAESIDVTSIHAAIMRERSEPKEGREPISLWLITFIGVTLFWSGLYLQRYSGNYRSLIYDENAVLRVSESGGHGPVTNAPIDPIKLGRRVYSQICQACHQENGLGLVGQYPPLAKSEWVLAPAPGRLARIVLNGLSGPIQVGNQTYDNVMPAWRDTLSDVEIAAVLTYVRQEWENKAPEVKPEQVAALREKTKTRGSTGAWAAWTAPELMGIPETE